MHNGAAERRSGKRMSSLVKPAFNASLASILRCAGIDNAGVCEALFTQFGSYAAVFDAPVEALLSVSGMTREAALLLKLFPAVIRRVKMQENPMPKRIDDERIGHALAAKYYAQSREFLTVIAADSKLKIIGILETPRQSRSRVDVEIAAIIDFAVTRGAKHLLLSHNHPEGFALPSGSDNKASAMLRKSLAPLGISLYNHIITADDDFVSLFEAERQPRLS